mmetsp:Transcript_13468/g.28302  ORF Transcript_13468/g.28302 Transcript_13468/m.28302 type:complete len:354 (-) Transcript_13468:689-1750(-)|eukprot:CAMPEP_0168195812 /NCGR_PEP_ID=MMETSP0139_2-20121125/20105_1 /TAXON_ID=44445 /ORGANISM="Pseudo-nitzschia australis, Strain 10249 10 AB" /LENGTH=353 /DNA_ID=CAMNT_0008119791 /DNA_START=44 /DNA_END=1105 /DNA_ORIENTATION=-
MMMIQHLETFFQILEEPPRFEDSPTTDDKDSCERLLKEFNEIETEEIANISYAYWIVNLKAKERLPADAQFNSALKEIRRHYVGESKNYKNTLKAIREALQYRRKYRIDIIRSCCYDDNIYNDEDAALAEKYRSFLSDELERQTMVVRGVDADNRIIVYKPPRTSPSNAAYGAEAFILTQIYTAERAMATNEFTSKAKEEKVTVVFNFRDYSRKNSPPTSSMMTLGKVMQRCYPERLGILIISDPPFWMRAVFNVVWPILSTATIEKIRMPLGQKAVNEEFSKVVEDNKKLKDLLLSGDISSVDVADYMEQPFYSQYEYTFKKCNITRSYSHSHSTYIYIMCIRGFQCPDGKM